MEEQRQIWASIIRSCILSSKEPLTPDQINNDTKMLEGKNIPYKRLKYNSLLEMLKDINGLKVFKSYGKTLVKVIASEETAHVQKMVRLQKKSKKKLNSLPQRFNNRQLREHESANIRFNRPRNTQRYNNVSLQTGFDQSRLSRAIPPPQLQRDLQQYYQQQQLPSECRVLVLQPIIQVVPYPIDPQLILNNYDAASSLQLQQYLQASYFQIPQLLHNSSYHM